MNRYAQTLKNFFTTDRKYIAVGVTVCLGIAVLFGVIILFIYNSAPKIAYQPAKACDLLNPKKARELLGDKIITSAAQDPVVSGNFATSKCGYTNGNPDMNNVVVAAIIVRSGINDVGVQQNKTEFAKGKPTPNAEDIKNVGDSAYFNQELGQLNVLHGHEWVILSYGVGSSPQANTVDDAIKLAHQVLR